MRASIKARTTKSARGDVSRAKGRKKRRGSTWWTAGPGARGSSSGSGRQVKAVLSSCPVQMQQPKLCSNLTFQKHRLIQLSLLSPLLSYVTHHFLRPSALFHLFSFISRSYSCHIFSAPNPFLSITLPLYSSLLLSSYYSAVYLFFLLMVALLHSVSLHIRCG